MLNVPHYYNESQLMHMSHPGTLHSVEEMAMAVRDSLLIKDTNLYCGEVFKFVQICVSASVRSNIIIIVIVIIIIIMSVKLEA